MRIKEQKIEEFLEELSSKNPTPGGGAVAALTGATAAALVEMVVNLTRTEELKNLGTKAHDLKGKLLELADQDVIAFDRVMEAHRAKDKNLIKKALEGAVVVPEQTKEYACLIEEIAKVAEKKGNKNAVSDAKTAIHLARAAQKSAQENIDINKEALAKLG